MEDLPTPFQRLYQVLFSGYSCGQRIKTDGAPYFVCNSYWAQLLLPFQLSISPFDDIFQDECPLNLQQDHCLFHVLYFDEGIWLCGIIFILCIASEWGEPAHRSVLGLIQACKTEVLSLPYTVLMGHDLWMLKLEGAIDHELKMILDPVWHEISRLGGFLCFWNLEHISVLLLMPFLFYLYEQDLEFRSCTLGTSSLSKKKNCSTSFKLLLRNRARNGYLNGALYLQCIIDSTMCLPLFE